MKKILISMLMVATLCGIAKADTTTTRWSLVQPDIGSTNWGPKINTNYATIDNALGTNIENTVTSSTTFKGGVGVNGSTVTYSNGAVVTGTANHTGYVINGTVTDNSTGTVTGQKTFTNAILSSATANQIVIGTGTNTTTLNVPAPAAARTITIPDAGANSSLIESTGTQTMSNKTLDNATLSTNLNANSQKITGLAASSAAGQAVRFEQNKVVQYVFGTIAASSAAAINGTWATNLSTGMAPTSSSNKVLVWFTFPARISGTNLANGGGFTIKRNNATDLSGGASMANLIPQVSGQPLDETVTLFFVDTPATTSMTTYTIYVSANNTSNTVTTCVSNIEATLILEELAP